MNTTAKTDPLVATVIAWIIVAGLVVAMLFGGFVGCQKAKVYSAQQTGAAELARAQQNRRIAELDAGAEVARAHGVADANKIIANGLGGPEGYLRYLAIKAMADRQGDTIYVPTEAGIPITEAARFNKPKVE